MALLPAFDVACVLMVVAGALKLKAPAATKRSLELAGLRAPVRLLGLAEIAVGAWAAVRPGPLSAGLVALAYGGFCAFMLRLRRVAPGADCGCFGGSEAKAEPLHVVLNALACAVAVAAAISTPPALSWIAGRSALVAVPLVLGTAAAAYAAYLMFTVVPTAWSAYR